jgi:uncharacterized membrane protein
MTYFAVDSIKEKKKRNIWKEIAIGLIVLAIILGIIVLNMYSNNIGIDTGIKIGTEKTIQEIALSQVQTGNILITNGTTTITLPIRTICQNILDAQQGAKQ